VGAAPRRDATGPTDRAEGGAPTRPLSAPQSLGLPVAYGMTGRDEIPRCRPGCGACCIAPSIASPLPGMPDGKPAGVRCVQLTEDNRCRLFGHPERPGFCSSLRPAPEMCGSSAAEALDYLSDLERLTAPD
jgi:hypothetical protein